MGKLNNQSGFSAIEALLILVIVAIVGGTGFYVYHAQQNTNKNLSPTSSGTPTFKNNSKKQTPKNTAQAADKTPETVTAINTLLNKGDYLGLSNYMATTVGVVKQSTDYDGHGLSANEAASVIDVYFTKSTKSQGAALPWDFTTESQDRTRISQNADLKQYTSQGHIGISSDNRVIAYHLNADLKIDTVFMSVGTDLIQ